MTLANVITQLDAITFTGLESNAGFTYRQIPHGELPALVLDLSRSFPFTEGLRSINVTDTVGAATVICQHKLLITGIVENLVEEAHLAAAVDMTDDYLDELKDDLLLNGSVVEPVTVLAIDIGDIPHGGSVYFGVEFMLKLMLTVGSV